MYLSYKYTPTTAAPGSFSINLLRKGFALLCFAFLKELKKERKKRIDGCQGVRRRAQGVRVRAAPAVPQVLRRSAGLHPPCPLRHPRWLVLRPHKPRFYLQDLSVLCLNVTPPASTYLFTTMQATVAARNVNDRVGVYYDKVDAYAQYKDVPITVPTQLPVQYQDRNDQSVWSPYLASMDSVRLPPDLAVALAQDETAGYVLVDIRVEGRVRWKVGSWISSHYHLRVNCPALITVNDGKGSYGANTGGGNGYFRFHAAAACAVDV
jgi:hypothetical protein